NPKDCVECEEASDESPENSPARKVQNERGSPKRLRPLRLDGLTLTNMNNNRGQKPITNRDGTPNSSSARTTPSQNPNIKMKTVAVKLGLSADASEEIVLAEITRLLNRMTELAPHEEENKSLKDRIATFDGEQVHTLLD